MKKNYFLLFFFGALCNNLKAQSVSINTTSNAADTSAMLDVQSISKGLLIPKMTNAQRGAIALPANGLMVYQTDGQTGIYLNQGTPGSPNWQILQAGSATYRWCTFDTYDQTGWAVSNDPLFFGGINPSNWTDNNAIASSISSDKEVLRTIFTKKGYAKSNANIIHENYVSYSSTNGKVIIVLFRVKNTTASAITWTPNFYYSAYQAWSETASVALNGVSAWTSGATNTTSFTSSVAVALLIPANRTSSVIFVSTSSTATAAYGPLNVRNLRLVFNNNSLSLPAGLSFIDDLDTATGGWEQ